MTSPRERAQQQRALQLQQQALVRDLLPVLDALDRAETHWRQPMAMPEPSGETPIQSTWPLWRRWWNRWRERSQPAQPPATSTATVTATTAALAPPGATEAGPRGTAEGIGLIRAQLLEALEAHGLEPIVSLGLPFDPQSMQALGQRPLRQHETAGQVVEEALRGYRWQGTLLRAAQVLVAGP